jgi:mono/diheme cytochrome c family protein
LLSHEREAPPSNVADEIGAYERAKPVFDRYCAKCHTSGGGQASKEALKHFDMTRYPFGGHHASEIPDVLREVLGLDGDKPTMPLDRPGALRGAELQMVLDWIEAYERVHSDAGASEPNEHSN